MWKCGQGVFHVVWMMLGVLACEHSEPFAFTPPPPLGPHSTDFPPRQLTFNPLADRTPWAHGDDLLYSRRDPANVDLDACIARLPFEGGTIATEYCPPVDGRREEWLQPAVSPDGTRLAFVRETYATRFAQVPAARDLMVLAFDQPGAVSRVTASTYITAAGDTLTGFGSLAWYGNDTLGVVGGRMVFMGTAFSLDPVALVLFDVDGGAGVYAPGIADPVAAVPAPDGGVWFVGEAEPDRLYHRSPGGAAVALARFAGPVRALARGGTRAVAATLGFVQLLGLVEQVEFVDVATGEAGTIFFLDDLGVRVGGVTARPDGTGAAAAIALGGQPDIWRLWLP